MSSPADCRYLESHEWHKLEGDVVTLGISQFAVEELTDITYVEALVQEGAVSKGDSVAEVESVKATSEIYTGIDGEVIAVNQEVIDNPSLINEDPFGKGWLLKIKVSDAGQLDGLLSAADYDAQAG
ncbi:Glycine cleavage system H protein [Poriferisphaera corsica]|uniref:Glycine cleavage system H protein n=1 Tax=Poriferisphaera corsica TaxID=2528020 RepID=A0A517YSL3_9BACT|nr:glycine cleavage system protein GcvH [Poriferisphaera corsica]QDU33225.1 Glycine cleavage system H protein [Poriferisphaera corsica]